MNTIEIELRCEEIYVEKLKNIPTWEAYEHEWIKQLDRKDFTYYGCE